ncbi:MAG: hypothetical protein IKQ61_09305 [Spirochaetales bacterium]|nr:hypothetical protein [Spirochaetales bacterium]
MNGNPITIKTVADLERLMHWSKEYEQDIQRLCALRTVLVHLSETKNGISDLFEATTKGIIYDSYGHGKSYWKNNALEHEAMAHLFDARGCGGIKAEKMKRYLPLTYQYFTESIEKLGL